MANQPTLIIGANGQVGRALVQKLGRECIALTREMADLSKPESLESVLNQFKPLAVINAAAYTQVDLAEKEPALAFASNAESPGVIARWCAAREIPFVHYSTDYVFQGTGTEPWKETDPVDPLNTYGKTKLEGELKVAAAGGKYLIFRTSWVYDANGNNFLNTMLRLGKEREELKIVADQTGAPTYAADLAEATLKALRTIQPGKFPSGIYHLCNTGETTWHGFAQTIFEIARRKEPGLKIKSVLPIPSSAYPTPARRPHNSRLSTEKARALLGVELPPWKNALERCMELITL